MATKIYKVISLTLCISVGGLLASCIGRSDLPSIGGGGGDELKQVSPATISFLDSQIDHLTLSDAILQWGQPTFFTQTAYNNIRTAIWNKRDSVFSYGDFLGQFDPTNTYNKVNGLFGGNDDTGWELRATFNQHDVLIDWRYKEW